MIRYAHTHCDRPVRFNTWKRTKEGTRSYSRKYLHRRRRIYGWVLHSNHEYEKQQNDWFRTLKLETSLVPRKRRIHRSSIINNSFIHPRPIMPRIEFSTEQARVSPCQSSTGRMRSVFDPKIMLLLVHGLRNTWCCDTVNHDRCQSLLRYYVKVS